MDNTYQLDHMLVSERIICNFGDIINFFIISTSFSHICFIVLLLYGLPSLIKNKFIFLILRDNTRKFIDLTHSNIFIMINSQSMDTKNNENIS